MLYKLAVVPRSKHSQSRLYHDRQCKYNVTSVCIRINIVAFETQ